MADHIADSVPSAGRPPTDKKSGGGNKQQMPKVPKAKSDGVAAHQPKERQDQKSSAKHGEDSAQLKERGEKPSQKKPLKDNDSQEGSVSQISASSGNRQSVMGSSKAGQTAATKDTKIGSTHPRPTSRLAVFDHLPRKKQLDTESIESDRLLHPAIIKLGCLYRAGVIQNDDDRVCALFAAFCNVVKDYKTPPKKILSWDFDKHVRLQVQHLVDCRQLSMSMGNFIKFFRFTISQVPSDMNEADAKDFLLEKLHGFIEERIAVAQQNIAKFCTSSIRNNDVILTFGSSPVIRQVLLAAAQVKTFRLIVVDVRPLREAMKTVVALSPHVSCMYTPLSCAASVMKEATKVILGASALLSNGSVLAPAGTAMVAELAKFFRVPVIIAAESYKFCEKVQLDSIVYNELGSCSELVSAANAAGEQGPASDSADNSTSADTSSAPVPVMWTGYKGAAEASDESRFPFQVINLRYDITPIESVSVVATEAGMIPPTSVPVLIRELRLDQTGPAITTTVPGNQGFRK